MTTCKCSTFRDHNPISVGYSADRFLWVHISVNYVMKILIEMTKYYFLYVLSTNLRHEQINLAKGALLRWSACCKWLIIFIYICKHLLYRMSDTEGVRRPGPTSCVLCYVQNVCVHVTSCAVQPASPRLGRLCTPLKLLAIPVMTLTTHCCSLLNDTLGHILLNVKRM